MALEGRALRQTRPSPQLTPEDITRFWQKVEQPHHWGECWKWTGTLQHTGYGTFKTNGANYGAHRIAYQLVIGDIVSGLYIDHLCRNRGCVNPYHMEPVSLVENVLRGDAWSGKNLRKTHCPKGHPLTPDNIVQAPSVKGRRNCKTCKNEYIRRYRQTPAAREADRIRSSKAYYANREARIAKQYEYYHSKKKKDNRSQ